MSTEFTIREYSELKLENLRLRNELKAQKELYERCLEDFAKLLENMNTMYESKVVDKPISKTKAKLQSPPPVVAPTHKPTSSNQKAQQRRTDAKSQASVSSNCIQEIEKNTLTVPLVSKFTESALKRLVMVAIQNSNIEEYLYLTLGPHITNENIQIVYNVVYRSMTQSVNLLKEFDYLFIEQRASLFSTLLNYLLTRFESFSFSGVCYSSLKKQLESDIFVKHVKLQKERFSPSFIALLLIYYDLCKINHMEDSFKQTLYSLFKMAGEFPIRVVYSLWKHDRDVFVETCLYDTIINSIIGHVLTTYGNDLPPFQDMVKWYKGLDGHWDEKISEIETSALQCVLNAEGYTQENADVYSMAGKSLALLYVYRGGTYAIQSLNANGIFERIDDSSLDSKYRLFLLYIILWCAESSLFGNEWFLIREAVLSLNLITDEVRQEFLTLFAYFCFFNKHFTNTHTILTNHPNHHFVWLFLSLRNYHHPIQMISLVFHSNHHPSQNFSEFLFLLASHSSHHPNQR